MIKKRENLFMETEEILEECKDLIEQVCIKFGYSTHDEEGNKSLRTILLEIVPRIIKGRNKEDRELFYQMLSHTPIVIIDNITPETYDKLLEQYIGKDIKTNISYKKILIWVNIAIRLVQEHMFQDLY